MPCPQWPAKCLGVVLSLLGFNYVGKLRNTLSTVALQAGYLFWPPGRNSKYRRDRFSEISTLSLKIATVTNK